MHTYFYLQEKEDKSLNAYNILCKNQSTRDYADREKSTKKSETSLATSRSNQSYNLHNHFLSTVARYIIFIIIFHLLTLVQYLISMFHLNCLSAFSLLVQAIISCHQSWTTQMWLNSPLKSPLPSCKVLNTKLIARTTKTPNLHSPWPAGSGKRIYHSSGQLSPAQVVLL